jgi:hypothetical protein
MIDLRGKITQWLTVHLFCLSRHIRLDRTELLSGFYMILKVHKTPVMSYFICNVHSSITSLASLLALRILTLINGKLKRVLSNTPFKLFYCVCLSIDEVLSRTKKTHSYNTSITSYFYLCDLVTMYFNLNPTWCIVAILKLVTDYNRIDSSRIHY